MFKSLFLSALLLVGASSVASANDADTEHGLFGLGLGGNYQLRLDDAFGGSRSTGSTQAVFMIRRLQRLDNDHLMMQGSVDVNYNILSYNDRGVGTSAGLDGEFIFMGAIDDLGDNGCTMYFGVHVNGGAGTGFRQYSPVSGHIFLTPETGLLCNVSGHGYFTVSPMVGVGTNATTVLTRGDNPAGVSMAGPLVMGGSARFTNENLMLALNTYFMPSNSSSTVTSTRLTMDLAFSMGERWSGALYGLFQRFNSVRYDSEPGYDINYVDYPRDVVDLAGGFRFVRVIGERGRN